jgi:hypothetical protein
MKPNAIPSPPCADTLRGRYAGRIADGPKKRVGIEQQLHLLSP